MPDTRIFILGVFFTLIVVAGIVLLIWAAVEDGRVESERPGLKSD
jgi:phosphotransferase system  glucose/maltose/N-acetylglucosamine-specific IIC component